MTFFAAHRVEADIEIGAVVIQQAALSLERVGLDRM